MEFSREILFFFSALGAFNGLVIGLYFLFFAKPKHRSNYFLGVLLLALSIRIGKSVFLYFSDHMWGGFLQFGMSACLFIGPSLYFYLKSIMQPDKTLNWKIHYLPLLIIISTIDVLFPWHDDLWYYLFHTIYFVWLIYLIFSGFLLRETLKNLFKRNVRLSTMEVWIVSIYIGNSLIWIAYNTVNYTSYIVGALSFTFIFYLLILLLFFTRKKDPGFLNKHVKYGNKKIDEAEAQQLQRRLNELMENERLFKDANLKMSEVAKKLNILPHYLSQFINDNLNKNFTIFINEYRITEAKKLIKSDSHLKLESIGYECGFNSKSTFYTAFKKIAGTTPAKFKESHES
ncbi:MAG: helix-turn-helix domain-containing protein [Ekhidna sp.]